jgi:FAD-dependent oxidoreductase family protein
VIADSVGLAAYNMDSHNCQRVARDGRAENEGDVQVPPMKPYPISYRAIVPKAAECENLLAPVCLSASHIAYGSIRMEPVFMILGQSAATAAVQALDDGVALQRLDYAKLRRRLLADKQILEWSEGDSARGKLSAERLEGLVMDDRAALRRGEWVEASSLPFRVGTGYVHDNNQNKGKCALKFIPMIATPGEYEIFLLWPPASNRATNVQVSLARENNEPLLVTVNQRSGDGRFSLGRHSLAGGSNLIVTVFNGGTDGHVVVDALQLVPTK